MFFSSKEPNKSIGLCVFGFSELSAPLFIVPTNFIKTLRQRAVKGYNVVLNTVFLFRRRLSKEMNLVESFLLLQIIGLSMNFDVTWK